MVGAFVIGCLSSRERFGVKIVRVCVRSLDLRVWKTGWLKEFMLYNLACLCLFTMREGGNRCWCWENCRKIKEKFQPLLLLVMETILRWSFGFGN